MIGVAQDDLGVDVILQFAAVNTFDGAVGANGHEDRCQYITVVGVDDTCTWSNGLRIAM